MTDSDTGRRQTVYLAIATVERLQATIDKKMLALNSATNKVRHIIHDYITEVQK